MAKKPSNREFSLLDLNLDLNSAFQTPTSKAKKANLTTDLKHHGIILHRHSTILDLYTQSGPNAKGNEFQMHYWMLIFRHQFEDGGFFDIAYPTCYFNYEQHVTSAHIDFEMKDVATISPKLLPIHNMLVNQILATGILDKLHQIFPGLSFTPISVDVGTLHRHPGSSHSQRFSGTDLDANDKHHGIVFPLTSGTDKPSFSGILAVDSGECNVAHYEYRLVNGSYATDNLSYVKGRCISITLNDTYTPPSRSAIENYFLSPVITAPRKIKEDHSILPPETVTALEQLISTLPTPNTLAVRPENVKVKQYKPIQYSTPSVAVTAPFKFNYKLYHYPHGVLLKNLEQHLNYHKLPYKPAELLTYNISQLHAKLDEVYNYVPPVVTPEFTQCPHPIHTLEQLQALTRVDLIKHHNELDSYYYGVENEEIHLDDTTTTQLEIIDTILELYLCIHDEEQEALKNPFIYIGDEDGLY